MSKREVAALLSFVATVGAVISTAEASSSVESRERAWRSGFNKTREQARRVRQRQRLEAKRAKKGKTCPCCFGLPVLIEKYDAYGCPFCDRWLEEQCESPTCSFCVNRPTKPSEEESSNEPSKS